MFWHFENWWIVLSEISTSSLVPKPKLKDQWAGQKQWACVSHAVIHIFNLKEPHPETESHPYLSLFPELLTIYLFHFKLCIRLLVGGALWKRVNGEMYEQQLTGITDPADSHAVLCEAQGESFSILSKVRGAIEHTQACEVNNCLVITRWAYTRIHSWFL